MEEERKLGFNPPVTLSAERAIAIISDFLTEEWASLTPDDIIVSRLKGGYMNTIHKVERKDGQSVKEPHSVIIRGAGSELSGVHHDPTIREEIMKLTESEEVLIFNEMMKRKQCPRLIGLIEKGRVEEFRLMHGPNPDEVLMPKYMEDIAKAFARMHTLDLPLSKRKWATFWQTVEMNYPKKSANQWIKTLADETGVECITTCIDYGKEIAWLNRVREKYFDHRSRDGLIQADTHYMNLVVNEDPRPGELNVWLIDYELCSYGPRGLDLGAHFLNRQLMWNNVDGLSSSGTRQHTHEERIQFLKFYQNELRRLNIEDFDENGIDSIDNLLFESYVGALLYHLFFLYIAFFIISEEQARAYGAELLIKEVHDFSKAYLEAKRMAFDQYPFLNPTANE